MKQAGLPRIRFHDLRHTAATLMLREGIRPKVVQEILGHGRMSVMLDIYRHVAPGSTVKLLIARMRLFAGSDNSWRFHGHATEIIYRVASVYAAILTLDFTNQKTNDYQRLLTAHIQSGWTRPRPLL